MICDPDCAICDTDHTVRDTDLLMDAEASAYTYGSVSLYSYMCRLMLQQVSSFKTGYRLEFQKPIFIKTKGACHCYLRKISIFVTTTS